MKLTNSQRLILFALSRFYQSLNQSLTAKHLQVQTSKITFIELLLESKIISRQERTIYKNLEALEKNKLIAYDKRMIKFTNKGFQELKKIELEVMQFNLLEKYFSEQHKIKRKLQTVIKG